MGSYSPLTRWTQLLLFPPESLRVQLSCSVHGPTSSSNYTLSVMDESTYEEVAVATTDTFDASVLPARVLDMLRDQLAAARVAVIPF